MLTVIIRSIPLPPRPVSQESLCEKITNVFKYDHQLARVEFAVCED